MLFNLQRHAGDVTAWIYDAQVTDNNIIFKSIVSENAVTDVDLVLKPVLLN